MDLKGTPSADKFAECSILKEGCDLLITYSVNLYV